MYRISCTVYYPAQQMHNMYINTILYNVNTPTCFNEYASPLGSLNLVLC